LITEHNGDVSPEDTLALQWT